MSKLIIALYVLTTSLALVILKLGAKDGAPAEIIDGRLSFNLTRYSITGVVLYGVSFILYTYLLSKYDLGYIIPLAAAFVYILIFIASYVIFNEAFTILKLGAILMIVLGLILLNIDK